MGNCFSVKEDNELLLYNNKQYKSCKNCKSYFTMGYNNFCSMDCKKFHEKNTIKYHDFNNERW